MKSVQGERSDPTMTNQISQPQTGWAFSFFASEAARGRPVHCSGQWQNLAMSSVG